MQLCQAAGPNGYLFVLDMMDAYWRVPIHPSQYKYNGLYWHHKYWVFTSLQMGLASSAQIYTRFADSIAWMVVKKHAKIAFKTGVRCLHHYLDDFFGACKTKADADKIFNYMLKLLYKLGIPTKPEKCYKPSNKFQRILGWGFKQSKLKICMLKDKRVKYLNDVNFLLYYKLANRKFLEQVKGRLNNVAQIRFPGKAMLRRLDALIYLPKFNYSEPIPINSFVARDLKWWKWVLEKERRCEVSYKDMLKSSDDADLDITTDAASEVGIGGHSQFAAFQIKWSNTRFKLVKEARKDFDICGQEYLGSIVAAELFGPSLRGKSVTIYNDNPGAAAALGSKAPPLSRLDLHFLTIYLAKIAVEFNFKFWAVHCTDERMKFADGLSRFFPQREFQISPRYKDLSEEATIICNNIMDKLARYPNNLPNKRDISFSIRYKFKILFDEKYYKEEKMKKQKYVNELYNDPLFNGS